MTVYFKWLDEYSLGVQEIDDQHKFMFQLANEIQFSELSDGKKYADKLYNYTKWHFSVEEKYFSELKSPHLMKHMEMHNILLEGLVSIMDDGLSTYEDLEKLKAYYLKWLVEHILYQDRKAFREQLAR